MQEPDPLKLVTPREGPGRRKRDGVPQWQELAPRWLLVAIIPVLFGWAVYQQNARQVALEEALSDAANKAQTRLLERVAVTEEQQRQTNSNMEKLIMRLDKSDEVTQKQNAAITDLTVQLRLLTAQLKRVQ